MEVPKHTHQPMLTTVTTHPPMLSICQQNVLMAFANKKAMRARKQAVDSEVDLAARKRFCVDALSAAKPVRLSADRTSTRSFSAEPPKRALAALRCIDLERGPVTYEFAELGITAYKFSVRFVSEKMATFGADSAALSYPSVRAASLMAAKATRYVFDVALEIADSNTEQYIDARKALAWHTPQMMIKGRETRGAGIAMYSVGALELLRAALQIALERVQARVDMEERHRQEVDEAAFKSTVVARECGS